MAERGRESEGRERGNKTERGLSSSKFSDDQMISLLQQQALNILKAGVLKYPDLKTMTQEKNLFPTPADTSFN